MAEVQRIRHLLIHEFAEMLAESKMASFRAIERLVTDWETGINRSDRSGEALFIARQDDRILGVCGLNRDPYNPAKLDEFDGYTLCRTTTVRELGEH